MIEFVRTIWRELLSSLGETFSLFRGDGVPGADVAAFAVRLLVSLLVLLLAWLVYGLARRALAWTLRRTRFPASAQGPLFLALRTVVLVLAVLAVLGQFGISRALLGDASLAALFAFAFYLLWWTGNRVVQASVRRAGLDRSLRQLLRNVLAVSVAAVGFVMVMDQFGVNVLAAITALGVVGIAVGFAAQETLSNFIAGITLLIERPFRLGEWVDVGGKVGRVESIRLRTTLIVDRDNVHTIIPNAQVAADQIVNLSGGGPLRLRIELGIAYKESAAEARDPASHAARARGHPARRPLRADGAGDRPGRELRGPGGVRLDSARQDRRPAEHRIGARGALQGGAGPRGDRDPLPAPAAVHRRRQGSRAGAGAVGSASRRGRGVRRRPSRTELAGRRLSGGPRGPGRTAQNRIRSQAISSSGRNTSAYSISTPADWLRNIATSTCLPRRLIASTSST